MKKKNSISNSIVALGVIIILAGIPAGFIWYQSKKSDLSPREVLQRKAFRKKINESSAEGPVIGSLQTDSLSPVQVGFEYTEPPMISNLAVHDLDNDSLPDIIVCDSKSNFVSWIRQYPQGVFRESILAEDLIAPAHVQITDFDLDGDNDIMVAVLGMLFPSNDKIGSVVILENNGDCTFNRRLVISKIARVSDVRAGDLDGDGDNDLAVAQFGYDDGETRWMENLGNWKFRSHILQSLSGPVNIEITDIDHDGDNDLISLVSQEWEEIYCFINDGKGSFKPGLIWGSTNEDYGSSGIFTCDLDKDGDTDILYTNGDAFDYIPPQGRPWHGVQWLENTGDLEFSMHRICDFIGAFSPRPADMDNDGDNDLFVVSAFNLWDNPASQSFIWLENNGMMEFAIHNITNAPTHLLTMEPADFNNDGNMDFVTGGMHAYQPYDRMGRVTIWMEKSQ
jgi:hypothetical protein